VPPAELEAVGGMMAEIAHAQRGEFIAFADIHRPPLAVRIELGSAVVPVHATLIALGGEGRANGEASGDARRPRQRNEIRIEIRAVSGPGAAGIDCVSLTPAFTAFLIGHLVDDMVVERACIKSSLIPSTAPVAISLKFLLLGTFRSGARYRFDSSPLYRVACQKGDSKRICLVRGQGVLLSLQAEESPYRPVDFGHADDGAGPERNPVRMAGIGVALQSDE